MGRRIHVAIVSHGNASEVALLLGDLERHAANAEISVLLVVNQEEPLSFETHRFAFPLRIHRNQYPRGFGANNNLAFRLAAPSAAPTPPSAYISAGASFLDLMALARPRGLVMPTQTAWVVRSLESYRTRSSFSAFAAGSNSRPR